MWNTTMTLFSLTLLVMVAESTSVCSQLPYDLLLPLSNYPPAEAFCTSYFPRPSCTSTVSLNSVVTSTVIVSRTVSTKTVTSTTLTYNGGTVTATTTSTGSAITDLTTTGTDTVTVYTGTTTLTSYTTTVSVEPALGKRKREFQRRSPSKGTTTITTTSTTPSKGTTTSHPTTTTTSHPTTTTTSHPTTTTTNSLDALLSSLKAEASGIISTFCSCIEAQPTCTTTTQVHSTVTTPTVITSITSTTTVAASMAVTVTTTTTIVTHPVVTSPVDAATTTSLETTTTLLTATTTSCSVPTSFYLAISSSDGTYTDSQIGLPDPGASDDVNAYTLNEGGVATVFSLSAEGYLESADMRAGEQDDTEKPYGAVFFEPISTSEDYGFYFLECAFVDACTLQISCTVQGQSIFSYCAPGTSYYYEEGSGLSIGSAVSSGCTPVNVYAVDAS